MADRPARAATRGMSEADWARTVTDTATTYGWLWAHFRAAQTAKGWRTPMSGHTGFPDLVLARGGDVVLAELKRDGQQPRPDQRQWLAALGDHGYVWRPADFDTVLARLRRTP